MRNYRKYLAAALAATMVVGSSVVAQAADYVSSSDVTLTDKDTATGTIGGTGSLEGNITEDVFRVVVPQCMTDGTNFNGFNFVLDPQKLITKTEAAKYTTGSNAATGFDADKTLYFVNKVSGRLTDTSDFVKVTNKSSIPVNISLEAAMSGLGTIELSDTAEFADDHTSMYMALTDGTTPTAIKADGSTKIQKTVKEAATGAYETRVNPETNDYEYMLVNESANLFSTFEFALTGASNEKGDWSAVTANPAVQITWTIVPTPSAAPSIATTTYEIPATGGIEVAVNLGAKELAATDIKSITWTTQGGDKRTLTTDDYSFTDSVLKFKGPHLATIATDSRKYTVTFNDKNETTVDITLNKPTS